LHFRRHAIAFELLLGREGIKKVDSHISL
jgi:hypothetical protein